MKAQRNNLSTYRQILLLPLLLFSFSCEDTPEQTEEAPKPPKIVWVDPPPPDTGYNPANESAFEYTIWREYSELATQVPKRSADSVMKSVIQSSPDPRNVKKKLKEELAKLNALQDTLARYTIHYKYNISYDSIQAIIDEVEEKIKRGEVER